MKAKLFVFLFLIGNIIPNLLFGQFTQQGTKLVGTGADGNAWQGYSVAVSSDGNTLAEGGYYDSVKDGAVWVFTRSGGVWTQQGQKLVGDSAVSGGAWQGYSVAISSDGNTLIEGGVNNNGRVGAVWVFTRSGGVWTQQGSKLIGTGWVGVPVYQGSSVAVSSDGNTLVEGAAGDNSLAGAVWVFTRSGGVWTQQGTKLVGTGAVGSVVYQGNSVSISSDGNTFVEGGQWDNGGAGAVWVFTRSGGVWTQQGLKLVGTGAVGGGAQGSSVSISSDGNTLIEGGPHDNSSEGSVWVFTRSGGVWTQQGSKLVGTGDVVGSQGTSVSISSDGNTLVEGGCYNNGNAGAVWVFTRSGGVWTQLNQKLIGTGAVGSSEQGFSVAISSEGTAIEGGPYDNSNSGAVWVFHDPTISIRTVSQEVPKSYSLSQNYPNPFNPTTNIGFSIVHFGLVSLKIYDILGKEVTTLVNEQLKPATYEVSWDAINVASGVYFYKLTAGDFSVTKKMILMK